MGRDFSLPSRSMTVRRRYLTAAMIAYSALVIAVILTLPLTARLPHVSQTPLNTKGQVSRPTPSAEPSPTTSSSSTPDLRESDVERLRTMPLLRANGPVVEAFPDGRGLNSPDAVREVGNRLAKEAGIERPCPRFGSTLRATASIYAQN